MAAIGSLRLTRAFKLKLHGKLSDMETGKRNVSLEVAQRAVEVFGADATALPLDTERRHSDEELASELWVIPDSPL